MSPARARKRRGCTREGSGLGSSNRRRRRPRGPAPDEGRFVPLRFHRANFRPRCLAGAREGPGHGPCGLPGDLCAGSLANVHLRTGRVDEGRLSAQSRLSLRAARTAASHPEQTVEASGMPRKADPPANGRKAPGADARTAPESGHWGTAAIGKRPAGRKRPMLDVDCKGSQRPLVAQRRRHCSPDGLPGRWVAELGLNAHGLRLAFSSSPS